ncbi:DUF986 family protein, partial [Salmonella enterica subsp. enterica serovar Montevideo]|nr:DUF986 family protein [Salmonella enterica subsp. enterica serovar Montevideo]
DLAVLSRAIIHGEPEFYHMYSEKSLTWNGITQQNRNGLLWDNVTSHGAQMTTWLLSALALMGFYIFWIRTPRIIFKQRGFFFA